MTPLARELLTGGAAGTVLLLCYFPAHFPLLAALVAGIGTFVGGRFLVPSAQDTARSATRDAPIDPEALAARAFEIADSFGDLALQVKDADLRAGVEHIGVRIRTIFEDVRRRPRNLADAASYVSTYLPKAVKIVRAYIRLSGVEDLDEESRDRLTQAARTIGSLADALKSLQHRMFQDEVTQFEVDSGTLNDILAFADVSVHANPTKERP